VPPAPSVTWTCPNCHRRVPNRVAECHCGTKREAAERATRAAVAPPRPSRPAPHVPRGPRFDWRRFWRELPGDIKAFAIGIVLVTILAIVWLFVPHRPTPITPVLGWSGTVTPPTPKPTPRPSPSPRYPPTKKKWFPWW
jgi:hypothetical protein